MDSLFSFFLNSVLLGIALAMDSFSVSIADGLSYQDMSKYTKVIIPANFGLFQGIMPLIGWICVGTIAERFSIFQQSIPWIGFFLLLSLGVGMIKDGNKDEEVITSKAFTPGLLLLQGVATAIDALSVGFAIADYSMKEVIIAAIIIAVVTFLICCVGITLGNSIGSKFRSHATTIGGIILIGIGIETLLRGLLK